MARRLTSHARRGSTSLIALWCASCGGQSEPPKGNADGDPLGSVVATCGDLDAASAPRIAAANLERVLRGASRALDFSDSSLVLGKLFTGQTPAHPWDHAGLDNGIDDFIEQARDHWLSASNVESQSGGTVTYRLIAETMCGDSADSGSTAGSGSSAGSTSSGGADAGTVLENSCAKFYREHEIRVQARRVACESGENLHLDMLSGTERTVLLGADWYEHRLAHSVDVGATARTAESYGAFEHDVVVDRAEGRVLFEVANLANGASTITLAFPQAVDVQTHGPISRAGVTIAQADHALELAADPAARRITASTRLGAFAETVKLADFVRSFFNRRTDAPASEVVTLSVPGIDGEYSYDGVTDKLRVQHLGLGNDSTRVTRAGVTLLKIDANAAAARHVDVGVGADAQGKLTLDIQPGFRLDLEYAMASVNPLILDLEPFALDDTVTIEAQGAQGITLLEGMAGSVHLLLGNSGFLLMPSARFAISSRQAPSENVEVTPGSCLFRSSSPFVGQHHLLRELASRPCP